jgi:type II secretory pathway component PulF
MKESVLESVELFSRSGQRANVSDKAVAAVIHKLATTFLGVIVLLILVCMYVCMYVCMHVCQHDLTFM